VTSIVATHTRFRLRLGGQEDALPLGDFVIGRSAGCDLAIDDPVASRRHAVLHVMEDQVVLEDLGSRNGVLVNGVRMSDPVQLTHGDKVFVGSTELVLVETAARRRREDMATRPLIVSGVHAREGQQDDWEASTDLGSVYDVLIAACDRAFMQGNVEDAGAAVRNLLLSVRAALLRRQTPDPLAVRAAVGFALQLADRTGDASWLDRLFEVMVAGRMVPNDSTLERLTRMVPRLGLAGTESVRAFVGRMRGLPDLDADAQDRLSRLDGVVRQVGT
jgi:pSer/pThr/pTyr-binding forkhead associated (FHA) protein